MPPDFVYSWTETGMFLFVLTVTGFIATAVHMAFRLRPFRHVSDSAINLSPAVLAICGTLFTLSVTFLANAVWQSENRAREAVHEEARNIRVIQAYASTMVGTSTDSLFRIIGNYSKAVEREWPDMAGRGGSPQAEAELGAIYNSAILGLAEGDQNRLRQQRILTALDALSAARQQRLTMAREVVSGGQWFMVTALALLLIIVIAIVHGRFPGARMVAMAVVSLAISISLFVILAHDRPFVGYLAITPDSILDAAAHGPAT